MLLLLFIADQTLQSLRKCISKCRVNCQDLKNAKNQLQLTKSRISVNWSLVRKLSSSTSAGVYSMLFHYEHSPQTWSPKNLQSFIYQYWKRKNRKKWNKYWYFRWRLYGSAQTWWGCSSPHQHQKNFFHVRVCKVTFKQLPNPSEVICKVLEP